MLFCQVEVPRVIEVTKRLYAMEMLDDLLLKVVDETMKQVFRETGAKVIYSYLGNNSHLRREEIAEKTEKKKQPKTKATPSVKAETKESKN